MQLALAHVSELHLHLTAYSIAPALNDVVQSRVQALERVAQGSSTGIAPRLQLHQPVARVKREVEDQGSTIPTSRSSGSTPALTLTCSTRKIWRKRSDSVCLINFSIASSKDTE